jgi:hypothetical protein
MARKRSLTDVVLKKVIVSHLVEKSSPFYGNGGFITVLTKAHH